MMNNFIDRHLEKLIIAFVVIIVIALALIARQSVIENRRLLAQCMADGKKEYECVSMVRHSNQYNPSVIVIPAR